MMKLTYAYYADLICFYIDDKELANKVMRTRQKSIRQAFNDDCPPEEFADILVQTVRLARTD
jgi:hypothetical protein